MRLLAPGARAAALAALAALSAGPLAAQSWTFDSDRDGDRDGGTRAVLGVTTGSGGDRDTLGVLITRITTGGPADRARLEEGNRIAAVNGVNLRLAPADAGEPDMRGLATRRLTRELAKVRPGSEVELRVWRNGRFESARVRTVAADSLPGRRVRVARGVTREDRTRLREERERERESRAVLGIDLNPSGSRRDTLGVLITRVMDGGPAERAGLVEGDRVAAVNGVDLRVSRDDAGDDWVSGAKSSRFTREMQRARVGQPVELRVYSNGQFRTVRVTPARAGDVYKEGRGGTFFRSAFFDGDGMMAPEPPIPPEPPMAPMAPLPPEPPEPPLFDLRIDGDAISERVNEAMRHAGNAIARSQISFRRLHRI